MKYVLEYVWLGGNYELRSKIRVYETDKSVLSMSDLKNVPAWNYDGSSTSQTTGESSEIHLIPVSLYKNPLFNNTESVQSMIVLCETRDKNSNPLETNHRSKAVEIFNTLGGEPWFGLEQEYFILNKDIKQALDNEIKQDTLQQGQYYCSVGANNAFLRHIIDRHMMACISAGLKISGTNAEVAPYQWEFQIGPCTGIEAGDQLWIARYLLEKIAEQEGYYIDWSPKPFDKINGSGCHTNFSTKEMRDNPNGLELILNSIKKLEQNHKELMSQYGKGNDQRMSGLYETSSYDQFSFNFDKPVNRGGSVRISYDTIKDGRGYFEDRRPGSNMDPYVVTSLLFKTCVS